MKRFGVSIPESLAEDLDRLSKILGVSRSEVVREALKIYLREYSHYMKRHECCGIIVTVSSGVLSVVEDYRDIINNYTHVHLEDKCVDSFLVAGDSERIAEFHSKLLNICDHVRYIPLRCNVFKP